MMRGTLSARVVGCGLLVPFYCLTLFAEDEPPPQRLSKEEWSQLGIWAQYEGDRLTEVTFTALPTPRTVELLTQVSSLKSVDVMLDPPVNETSDSLYDNNRFRDEHLRMLFRLTQIESLDLLNTGVTDAGFVGISTMVNLRALSVAACKSVTDAAINEICKLPQINDLNLSFTKMTAQSLYVLMDHPQVSERLESLGAPQLQRELFQNHSWANLKSLRRLRLHGEVSFHAVLQLVTLTQLQSLDLQLTDLDDDSTERFAVLRELEEFKVPTWAYGSSLKHFANCPKLRTLDISMNNLTNSTFGELTQLEDLTVSSRILTLSYGAALANLRNLKRLRVSGLDDTTTLFQHIRGLTKLEELHVWKGKTDPESLRVLTGLPNLREIQLPFEQSWTDRHFAVLGQVTSLRFLWPIEVPQVTDAGLRHLSSLKQLERLHLVNAQSLTDACLPTLAGLRGLTSLAITGSGITETGAERLQQALPSTKIRIH